MIHALVFDFDGMIRRQALHEATRRERLTRIGPGSSRRCVDYPEPSSRPRAGRKAPGSRSLAGSLNVGTYIEQLLLFARSLAQEEQRGLAEGLTDEQLAIYDLLTRLGPDLTGAEKKQVKGVAEDLLAALKRDKLVLDWRKGQQTRAAVRVEIEKELDAGLPQSYDVSLFQQKADAVFAHIFDSYWDDGRSVYSAAA